jgi:hypothetical protein
VIQVKTFVKETENRKRDGTGAEVDYGGGVYEAHASSSRHKGLVGDKVETSCKHLFGRLLRGDWNKAGKGYKY